MVNSLLQVALYAHALLELPAAVTFYYKPSIHLPDYPVDINARALDDIEKSWIDATEPILHSYGILLLSSCLIAVLAAQPDMPIYFARAMGLFLAMYHIGPTRRAQARIGREWALGQEVPMDLPLMKHPKVHLVLHGIVGGLLAAAGVLGHINP